MLELDVRDDGCGGASVTKGSGLAGLCERVAEHGGTIAVTSPSAAGTTMAARLPLQPPQADRAVRAAA